jgi:hypothetical protein
VWSIWWSHVCVWQRQSEREIQMILSKAIMILFIINKSYLTALPILSGCANSHDTLEIHELWRNKLKSIELHKYIDSVHYRCNMQYMFLMWTVQWPHFHINSLWVLIKPLTFFSNLQSRNSSYSNSSVSCLFRSGVACDVLTTVSTGTWLPVLWRSIVPLSSGPSSLSCWTTWPWRWKNYTHPEFW